MKQKLYPLIATFLMLSLFSMSQLSSFEQKGIKKKISGLQEVKSKEKTLDTSSLYPLKFRLKKFKSFSAPNREGHVIGVTDPEKEGDEEVSRRGINSSSSVAGTPGQKVWSNFLGTDFYENKIGWPPDPNGAVGGSQVILCTNLGIKVFDKPAVTDPPIVTATGYSRDIAHSTLFLTLEKFFSPVLPAKSRVSDPHIRYDRLSRRWVVVAIEVNPPSYENNKILVAISDGDRVTDSSSFTYFSFNSAMYSYNKDVPYAPFLDYPMLGTDKNSVLIGGDGYFSSAFGTDSVNFVGYVIDKKKLMNGTLKVYTFKFGNYDFIKGTANGPIVPQAVNNDDPDAKKSFFVGIKNELDGLILANITYDKNNKPRLASESTIPVEQWNFPRNNTSPGGLTPLDMLDTRLFAAAIHKNKLTGNSSLWTAHAIGVNQWGKFISGSDSDFVREGRTGSRWYKIGNIYKRPGLLQSGTVHDGKEPSGRRAKQYFNPSVAASGQGHSIVSGTTDAYNEYLNVFAAGRYLGDPLGKTKDPVKVTNTTAIYAPYINLGQGFHFYVGRWGDYSQTVVDPLDDQTIWTFQEYADVDDSYGVRVVQFKAPPPATPAPIGTLFDDADTTIVLTGESVDNSGFFDPGPDLGGPGYNRLSVKTIGGVIASHIKFISPTKISFRLNTKNKPAGLYPVVITNPDGQVDVTYFIIIPAAAKSIAKDNSTAQRALIAQSYITRSSVFPNPTNRDVTLQITAAKEHHAKIVLIDVNGKQLFQQNYNMVKGSNQAVLPTEKLNKGTYIAVVYNSDNIVIATQKIEKQ
jgi:hypothetical protein